MVTLPMTLSDPSHPKSPNFAFWVLLNISGTAEAGIIKVFIQVSKVELLAVEWQITSKWAL